MATRYDKAEVFEEKLRRIYWIAMGAAVLHKATAWLGAGALTWATVVLMGGFASQISISDFKWITLLVLLILALLALSLFSIKLITRKALFIGSINPVHFTYHDHRRFIVTIIELASLAIQLSLITSCLWRGFSTLYSSDFKSVHFYSFLFKHTATTQDPAAPLQNCLQNCFSNATYSSNASMAATCGAVCLNVSASNNNLQICLYSFFLLLNATSLCATVGLVYGWAVKPLVWRRFVGDHNCLSLRRYHDEVLSRAMDLGLAAADDFDSRMFLLRALGEDLMMRNIGPLEVRRQNLEVIEYLYNHPQGSEMVYQGLASEDTLLQQAAANIVGFWAESNLPLDRQLELLCRMSDKLGLPGKAAEGAANSFSALAKQWALGTPKTNPKPVEEVGNSFTALAKRWLLKTKPIDTTKPIDLKPIEPSPLLRVFASQSRAAAGRRGGAAVPVDGAAAGGGAAVRGAGRGAAPPAYDSTGRGGAARSTNGYNVVGREVQRLVPAGIGRGAAPPADDSTAGGGDAPPADGHNAMDREADLVRTDDDDDAAAGGESSGERAAVLANDAAPREGAAGGGDATPIDGYTMVDRAVDHLDPADNAAVGQREAGGEDRVPADVVGRVEEIVATDDAAGGGEAAAGGGVKGATPTYGYNVVDKVIDLIVQKLAPTLLIYVRALDSFFMSASVREHVSRSGNQKGLEEKLRSIIKAKSDAMQPRTRLIAFFVLCRLTSSDGTQIKAEEKQSMEGLLKSVDDKFTEQMDKEPAGKKIMWVEESERYKDICEQLGKPWGAWLAHARINGKDLVAPGPDAVEKCLSSAVNGGVVSNCSGTNTSSV